MGKLTTRLILEEEVEGQLEPGMPRLVTAHLNFAVVSCGRVREILRILLRKQATDRGPRVSACG